MNLQSDVGNKELLKRESLRETVGIGNHHNRRIFLGGGVTPRNILLWGVWKVGGGASVLRRFPIPYPFFNRE